jgi:hypothetical protein
MQTSELSDREPRLPAWGNLDFFPSNINRDGTDVLKLQRDCEKISKIVWQLVGRTIEPRTGVDAIISRMPAGHYIFILHPAHQERARSGGNKLETEHGITMPISGGNSSI